MSVATVALRSLKTEAVATANKFSDYNFRKYFTKHAEDTFDAPRSEEETKIFVEGPAKDYVARMHRMAAVNQMYATMPAALDDRTAAAPPS